MALIDPDGTVYTRVGDKLIPNALPAVPSARYQFSYYADFPEEYWQRASRWQDDYGLEGLQLGPRFRKSLNETINLAQDILMFEAVHHQLDFGCPLAEIRRCCNHLQQAEDRGFLGTPGINYNFPTEEEDG